MSWLCHILQGQVPLRPPLGKWICDYCAEVWHEDVRMPEHTYKHDRKDFPMLAARAAMLINYRKPAWVNEVHYCSDACAEHYVSKVVSAALAEGGARR